MNCAVEYQLGQTGDIFRVLFIDGFDPVHLTGKLLGCIFGHPYLSGITDPLVYGWISERDKQTEYIGDN